MRYLSIFLVGGLMCLGGCDSGGADDGPVSDSGGADDGPVSDGGLQSDASVDECGEGADDCDRAHGTCVDTPSGYECNCEGGYALSADERACDDVDECQTDNGGCATTCTNSDGGHACSCDAGYLLNADGHTCDFDDWIHIAGGSFQMGSNDGEMNERPVHEVQVPAFDLWRTEVTVAQYRVCVDTGACTIPNTDIYCNWNEAGRDQHPINCVDWDQAQAFATWAGGRLPTEAEWEYAARSRGQDRSYPWGDDPATCDRAIMDDGGRGCGEGGTWPVCSKPAGHSDQGVCDLAGNVWEWTEDWYGDYDDTPRDGSAHMQASVNRVRRGGSWFNTGTYLRTAFRNRSAPSDRVNVLGFRLSRSVP